MTTLSIYYIGYSTFVVVPTDPENPLPQSDADLIATTLPRPTSSGPQHLSTVHTPQAPAGLEEEDLQLQAALQASLGESGDVSWDQGGSSVPASGRSGSIGSPPSSLFAPPPPIPPPSTRPADQPLGNPVAASMARNRAFLERMRQEQEAALREHYHDEVTRSEDNQPQPSFGAQSAVEDEDEQLRRAIAESAEMAREQGHTQTSNEPAVIEAEPEAGSYTGDRTQRQLRSNRVYDDEDAELQAALQASLGEGPPGFFSPDSSTESSPFATASAASARSEFSSGTLEDETGEGDTATEETGSDTAELPQHPAESLSIEEMRRRRLERFGQ